MVTTLDHLPQVFCSNDGAVEPDREITVAYPGRYQPYHAGHHDILRRILLKDASVFPDAEDRAFFTSSIVMAVVVYVVDLVEPKSSNPLSIGHRRELIEEAIERDPALQSCRHLVRTDYVQANTFSRTHLANLKLILPNARNLYVISGNPNTLYDAADVGLGRLRVCNRDNPHEQSATRIRKLIVDGDEAGVAKMLAPGGHAVMQRRNLFERIRNIAKGG